MIPCKASSWALTPKGGFCLGCLSGKFLLSIFICPVCPDVFNFEGVLSPVTSLLWRLWEGLDDVPFAQLFARIYMTRRLLNQPRTFFQDDYLLATLPGFCFIIFKTVFFIYYWRVFFTLWKPMPMTLFLSVHGTFFLSFIASVGNSRHLSNCHCSGIIFFLTVRDLLGHATILIHVPRCEFPFISPSWDCWGLLALSSGKFCYVPFKCAFSL